MDLGTGSGYLAFTIASKYPDVMVVGLDIVEKTLDCNLERASKEGYHNLKFVTYDGIKFPFAEGEFDIVVSRYALHHFPEIHYSISEVNRVLKQDGAFFLSDPTPNADDSQRFVDAYMQLKKDGVVWGYDLQYLVTGLLNQHPRTAIDFTKQNRTDYSKFYNEMTAQE